jgi:hypothetical protein
MPLGASEYTSWCVDRMGVRLHPGLRLRDDLPFPHTRGVVSTSEIAAGAVLASVPLAALLTAPAALSAKHSQPFFAALGPASEDDTLALALLLAGCDAGARWSALADAAPREFDLPFCWDDEEVAALDGSGVGVIAERMRAQRDADFAALAPRVAAAAAAAGVDGGFFTRDAYTWAVCCVWSRGVSLLIPGVAPPADGGDAGGRVKALAPFFEMFNTRPGAPVRHGYDPRARALVVTADAAMSAGASVCLDYGPRPTRDLIRLHGFAFPANAAETYQLEMAFRADAPDFARRLALLRVAPPRAAEAGAPVGERGMIAVSDGSLFAHFHLTPDVWADACVRFLRIMVAPPAVLDELGLVLREDANGGCSVELEIQVLRLLANSFVEILKGLAPRDGEADRARAFTDDTAAGDAALSAVLSGEEAGVPSAAPAALPAAATSARERRLQLAAVARGAERRVLESQLAMVEDAMNELRGVVTGFQKGEGMD